METPPSTSSTFETRYSIPKSWTSDDIYLGRNQGYKLTFLRRVIATPGVVIYVLITNPLKTYA